MAEKAARRSSASKGGRPPYRPTIENRKTVEEMKFCGESENVIARALGIDVDTMRKHFGDELADGHSQRRKEIIELLFVSARAGNISAIKRLEEMGRVSGAAEALAERARPTHAPARLGKKEEQQLAAERVEGKFAPPPPPKLIVNNNP